jgi:AraC family ethanolamine operon transcriptional activator
VDALAKSPNWDFRQLWFEDSDELAVLLGHRNVELTRLSAAIGRTRFVSGKITDLSFQAISTTGRHHLRGGLPAAAVVIQIDLGSSAVRRVGGQTIGDNDIVVGLGGAEFDFLSAAHHQGMNFSLPEALVLTALRQREPGSENLLRGSPLQVVASRDLWRARVRRLMGALLEAYVQPAGPRAHEHAHADISDTLLALLIAPWSRSEAASFRPVRYQRLPIVRRVIDFMRANLGEPLMMNDLCSAARASQRALEYAFHDVCGVAPKQYLKILRLNEVRRDLKALPPDVATVTSLAHQYGFWHMGHFSSAYRQLFGETPRQTRGYRA